MLPYDYWETLDRAALVYGAMFGIACGAVPLIVGAIKGKIGEGFAGLLLCAVLTPFAAFAGVWFLGQVGAMIGGLLTAILVCGLSVAGISAPVMTPNVPQTGLAQDAQSDQEKSKTRGEGEGQESRSDPNRQQQLLDELTALRQEVKALREGRPVVVSAPAEPTPRSPASVEVAQELALAQDGLREEKKAQAAGLPMLKSELERQVVELYSLLNHKVQRRIIRTPTTTDFIIAAQNGEKWIARCERSVLIDDLHKTRYTIINDNDVLGFSHVVQEENAKQAALITDGTIGSKAKEIAKQKQINLLDKTQIQEYITRARRVAVLGLKS